RRRPSSAPAPPSQGRAVVKPSTMRAARPRASHDLSRSFSTGVWSFELRPRPCTMSTQRCPSTTDSARKRSTATRAVADVMPCRSRWSCQAKSPRRSRPGQGAELLPQVGEGGVQRLPALVARALVAGSSTAPPHGSPLPQAARRSNRRSAAAVGPGVVQERAAALGRELLERLPGELARLHVPVLPAAHSGEGDAQGLCQPLLGEPDAPAPGADDAPRVARRPTRLSFAVGEHDPVLRTEATQVPQRVAGLPADSGGPSVTEVPVRAAVRPNNDAPLRVWGAVAKR